MKFFEAVANIFKIPDLRKRILFTLMMLAIYRLGGHIPTPGIDANRLAAFFAQNQGTLFGFIDLFSGGMFRRLTIFALGIMPYITASIILQLQNDGSGDIRHDTERKYGQPAEHATAEKIDEPEQGPLILREECG